MAFTVALKSTTYFDANNILTFDDIITNIGEHFSNYTSVFLCPYTGIYSFFLAITDDNELVHAWIMLENELIVQSRSTNNDVDDQGSNMAVIECHRGQRVWVQVTDEGYLRGSRDTTFSGFLIHVY